MNKEAKKEEWRKEHYIITGDTRLNGLTRDVAEKICNLLKSLGQDVDFMTEYKYRDECEFRGPVSTDNLFGPAGPFNGRAAFPRL